MKLSEEEKRMVYQIESTNQNAALNEIYLMARYARSQGTKDTAESLLRKTAPPVGQGVHEPDPGGAGKLPSAGKSPDRRGNAGGGQTASGAQKLSGHDIMALERFDPETRHMIVFDVLSHDSPMFLTEAGYGKALENQEKGFGMRWCQPFPERGIGKAIG